MKKFRLSKLQLTSDAANRSGLQTVNMTSSTPDTVTGTTFKNVLVDETGEFVVKSAPAWVLNEVYRWTTAPTSPQTGWLWVDTSGSGEVLKQWNGTARSELDHLSVSTIAADATIWDSPTLLLVDGNSWLPITATLPAPSAAKGRKIEVYKYRWASAVTIATPSWTIVNQYWLWALTYNFKNTNPNYFMTIRSDGFNWIVDDDNIYNRVANTLYVDLNFGNNTYAAREFESRPFLTVAGAVAASQPWDTIVLRNGNYAMWALILPHSLNFVAESWANRASWELWVPAWATVSYNWWTLHRSSWNSNLFVPRWDNVTITWYVEEWSADGISLYNLSFTTAYTWLNLTFSVWTMKWVGTTWVQFYLSRNASATTLTNCVMRYKGKYMEKNAWFRCWDAIDTLIEIQCDEYNWLNVWTNMWLWIRPRNVSTRSSLIYKWNKYYSNNITQPCFNILAESYNFDMYFDVKEFKAFTNILTVWAAANANIYCDGDYWSTKDLYAATNLQQSLSNPSWTTVPLKLYFNATEAEVISVASKPTLAWYWISGNVIWLTRWANAIITSKVLRSSKNEVIWIDHSSPQATENIAQWIVDIYWTRIEKLWRDVWAWYDWVIVIDPGSATAPAVDIPNSIIRFHNWAVLLNLWDDYWISQIAVNPTGAEWEIIYYDNVVTESASWTSLVNKNLLKETYAYAPTKTITASGTYTVTDYENDLYYDLTLGSLTLVLPDPTKFINREISIKATWLHATNTITIDPVWAALIDGSATYVVPNTSTIRTNVVVKSDGTWRWIK